MKNNYARSDAVDPLMPIPVDEDWPVSRLPEYADAIIRAGLVASRSCVALQVQRTDGSERAGVQHFAFVSFNTSDHPEFRGLFSTGVWRDIFQDSRRMEIPGRGELSELFANMARDGAQGWMVPLTPAGVMLLFLRKEVSDPDLRRFLLFNRRPKRRTRVAKDTGIASRLPGAPARLPRF